MANAHPPLPKPRLRGVVHQWSFFVALAGALVLLLVAPTAQARLAGAATVEGYPVLDGRGIGAVMSTGTIALFRGAGFTIGGDASAPGRRTVARLSL